ncbi:MAG: hypothetical protein AAGA09_05860 [Pseudomonadota bacterium]
MTGSRDSIIEDTADFPRRTDRRGPLAAAASMAVLVVGAAFLTFSIASPPPKKTTAQATPQPSEISVKVAPSAQAPDTAIETVQLAAVELPKPPKPIAISVEEALAKSRAARSKTAPVAGKPSEDERDGFTPRLKPTLALAKPGADENRAPEEKAKTQNSNAKVAEHKNQERSLTRPIRFGGVFLASDADRPGPIFFESDVRRRVYARAPAPITFAADQTRDVAEARIKVSKGETFVDALKRAGVAASDRNEAAFAFGKEYNLRRLQPGQEFALTLAWPNQTLFQMAAAKKEPEARLLALDFSIDPQNRIAVRRDKDGALAAEKSAVELTARTMAISGSINGSLFLSAKAQGAPNQTIADLANIFAYDIDFQREIFGGDEYEAIFDVYYDDEGRVVSAGDIHFARMKWRGRTKEKAYYRFASANGGARADYYDAAGQSAKRLLMKTPIDGARLSSGFGTRRHPISGYRKQHKGVDFAARHTRLRRWRRRHRARQPVRQLR